MLLARGDLRTWASAGREGTALSREYAVHVSCSDTPGHSTVPARRERPCVPCGCTGRRLFLKEDPMTYEVTKTDDQWALELEPQEFAVLRRAGTERPWTGELLDEKR